MAVKLLLHVKPGVNQWQKYIVGLAVTLHSPAGAVHLQHSPFVGVVLQRPVYMFSWTIHLNVPG
jgi:hypothetical protein